jgi:hypothetical protein
LREVNSRPCFIFGRIFGAKRQKPGFPLLVLGFAYANPVGFPLQSPCAAAAQNQFPELPQTIPGQLIAAGT